jgi:hypothetical protein
MPKGIYVRNKDITPWNKGKSGYKTKPASEERKKKISSANKGKVRTREMNEENRLRNLGKKNTPEQIQKFKEATSGKKHWNWKGGISKNKSHLKELNENWLKKNYQQKLWLNSQRRVKKLCNGGSHNLAEWENLKAQYNWTCPCCKRFEPVIVLTRDHIIPLSKGGSDNIENIQPLCKSCNCRKHDKIISKY